MSEPGSTTRRPLVGLLVVAGVLLGVVSGVAVWQQVRWAIATPLATAFHDHVEDWGGTNIRHAEIRKFISLDLRTADELARSAGFHCRGLTVGKSLVLCYRDVWSGLCKELWSLELVYGRENKITRATGRKRAICYLG